MLNALSSLPGEIQISFIELDVSRLKDCPEFWTEGKSLLPHARLLLDSILPAKIDRVIYLDVDLFIQADLSQLYSLDLCGHEIAACIEKICPQIRYDFPTPLLDFEIDESQAYFNSGVMLIDVSAVRSSSSFAKVLNMLNTGSNQSFKYADQSALNYYYQGSFLSLDEMWNIQLHTQNYSQHEIIEMLEPSFRGIFHFVSQSKPWNTVSFNPIFVKHLNFLNSIVPDWKAVITYHHETKIKAFKKKISFLIVVYQSLRFLLSPADGPEMSTLLYWINLHQQKKFFMTKARYHL